MDAPSPDARRLARATGVAIGIAAMVLLVAVLPAEYGVDPTGLGGALGFSRLHEGAAPAVVDDAPEEGARAVYEMRATWRLVEIPVAVRTGYVSRAESTQRLDVPLAIPNLTSVTARLSWDDTDRIGGAPTKGDTLEVSIRGPDGLRSPLAQATNEPGQPGEATTTLSVRSVPYPQENATTGLTFPTTGDAPRAVDWTFVVRLYTAGGVDGSDERDPGQSWTLTVMAEAYELDVVRDADRLGDRVRLTLAPGQAVEYKFAMLPNATMAYRWNATAPVYFDLHADHFDDPDNFQTLRTGTSALEEGRYTAPYDGRHGWYFLNEGASTVTITLETTGDYTILGAV